ncbi:MAG: SMC-Scp complex subunit ScpB [Kiritimatiellae bacterium]|nr:SMC-Scp complex subunit ScpB [Kiritimatiellia bacterium]
MPELKQILGAMIFGANSPLTIRGMLKSLKDVAEEDGGETKCFLKVRASDVRSALDEITAECEKSRRGFFLVEVAGGFKFQTDPSCGVWLKSLLDIGRPSRLSRPALETLAIIAYRQPVVRSEIEAVRGVTVDHIVRGLMEMQLIKITGRSDLPGRPFMYGTTKIFLDHFGLKDLDELRAMEPMLLLEREAARNELPLQDPPCAEGDTVDGEPDDDEEVDADGEQEVLDDES